MDQSLKIKLARTAFRFKKLTGASFGMENKSNINMTELVLMKGISNNSTNSENNIGLPDIRDYLSISKAAVSQKLSSLEKKGYINRDIDKKNRRNLIVTLTPSGREILSNKEKEFDDKLEKIMINFGEDDIIQLITTINHLIEVINKINDESEQDE